MNIPMGRSAAASLAACAMLCAAQVSGAESAGAPGDASVPTFSGEVAHVIYNQCTPCHRPDGGAPFPLVTYEDVKRRARMIADVVESGYMPPWKVAASDLSFRNARHMPDEQKALLAAWAEAGAPLGDAQSVPPAPEFPSSWTHGVPDLVLEMEEDMPIPASGTDIYRNFVVRIPDLPPGKYLKGLEYKPRAITTAHHTLFSLDSTGRARQQSEAQPRPGYSGGGGAGGGAMGRFAGWAVGSVPAFFPPGAAIEIPPGTDLVLSSHFHPTGKPEIERAQIALYLTDEAPVRQINTVDVPFMFGVLKNLRIPAGEANYVVREQYTVPVDARLASLSPHAHYLAKSMHATATLPDGNVLTLISINDWDFAWQEQYELAEEIALPKGTRIDMEFVYDNSAENPRNPTNPPREVMWGLQSTDEMACITLGIITGTKDDRDVLRREYAAWIVNDVEKADPRIALASFGAMNRDRFDLNGDGEVSWGERWQMGAQIYGRITSRGNNSPGNNNGMSEIRAQILPVILRRVFLLLVLPWLLPRAAVLVLLLVALVVALRYWRARRRRAIAAMEADPAPEAG